MAIVYALVSNRTGFAYVGVTSNMAKRFREHRCLLRNNKHHAKKLQDDWNYWSESCLGLVMLELQPTDYANRGVKCETEQHWIDFYQGQGLLYNANRTSEGFNSEITRKGIEAARIANTGRVHSAESREKRRQSQLGKPKGHGAKISATKKALGQKPTPAAASLGGIAACAKRWGTSDEIV